MDQKNNVSTASNLVDQVSSMKDDHLFTGDRKN